MCGGSTLEHIDSGKNEIANGYTVTGALLEEMWLNQTFDKLKFNK